MLDEVKKHIIESVDALVQYSFDASTEAGWWVNIETGESLINEPRMVEQKLCLIHSEVSEVLEAHRKNLMDDKLPHRHGVEVELADVMIRVFDLAGALGLDVGGAMAEKMEYNATRPDHQLENRKSDGGKKY